MIGEEKMASLKCNVTEINYGFIVIEADSAEEAQDKVLDEYNNGNVIWTNSTISEITAEQQENRDLKNQNIT